MKKGKPCGKGFISKEKECRIKSSHTLNSSTATKALVGGVATVGTVAIASHIGSTLAKGSGKIPRSNLQVVDQDYVNGLTPIKGKEIKQGMTGTARFVKDREGNNFVLKQAVNPLFLYQGTSEVIASEIGNNAGINVNKSKIIPANVKTKLKTIQGLGGTLHGAVAGENLHDIGGEYQGLRFVQRDGLTRNHVKQMSRHPDLPKIVALDTFVGNRDRSRSNLFYDKKSDRFSGIDLGDSFRHTPFFEASLPKKARKNFEKMDFSQFSPEERQAAQSYLDTLKQLHKDNSPQSISQKYRNYIRLEGGGLDVLRQYVSIKDIFENHKESAKLISVLESKLTETRTDGNGIPCGKGWISKEKECQIKSSGTTNISGGAIASGVAIAGAGLAAGHIAYTINKGKGLPDSPLNTISQQQVDGLKLKSKIAAGQTGNTYFVEGKAGESFVMKESTNWKALPFLQQSSDVIGAEIGLKAGIKVNEVSLIPGNVKHPLIEKNFGATLHKLVPGKPGTDSSVTEKFGDVTLSQYDNLKAIGITPKHLPKLAKHTDLAKMAALDTYTGNWDRNNANLFYDDKSDSFYGIDMGVSHSHLAPFSGSLPRATMKSLKDLDVKSLKPEEVNGLKTYVDTLKTLHNQNDPKDISRRYEQYIKAQNGNWNLFKRYVSISSVYDNHAQSKKLVEMLEDKMRDRNDSWREDKGIPCGKGWISKEKKCQIKASGGSGDGIKIATGAGVAIAGIGVAGLASTYFLQKNTVNSDIDTPIELLPDDLKQRRQWYDSEIQRISQEMNGLAASEKAAKSRHKQEQSQQSLDNYSCAYLERRSKGDDAFNLHFNKLADGYDVRNKITPLTSNVDNRGRKMFVARHAEREDYANPNFKPQRRHDSPLSDNGLEQAKEIAKTLKGKGINEIYVSPFLRTVQTANAIAEELDISLKIEPGMAEWHNASWHSKPPQVMTKEELKKLFPRVDLDYESPHRPNYPETSDDVLTRSRNTALDIAKKSKGNALMLGHGPSVIGAARGLDGGSPVVLPQFAGVVEFEGTKTGWANKGISHPSKTKKPAKCSGRGDSMIREDKGIPCGKGWISKEKECRVGRGSRRVKTPDKRNPLNGKLIKQAAVTGGVVSVGAVVAAIAYQQHSSIIKEKEGDRKAAADVYAHFSNRPDLVEKFTLSGKGGNKPWKPEMSAKEAEEWSKDSAFPGSAYHLTSHWAAGKIKEGGFLVPKKAAVGRDHGDGVYLGFNETAKTDLANFYSDLVGKGNNETLEVRTNLRKVLDLGAVKKEAESQGFEFQDKKVGGSFLRPEKTKLLRGIENPETKYGGVDLQLMRIAAASMGKKDDLEKRMAIARKEGHEAPEGIAFGEILQEMGYDGLTSASTEANSLTEKKPHPGILLVFDPKRIAVVKNKGDIGFNKTKQESFELNGRSLKSEPPPQDYSKLTDNLPFKEPPFDYPVKGSARKSGVTIVEPDGRVWMMKVKGNYGGENFSGPRGGSEPGLTDWQNAVKEAREELGLNVKIVDYLGDFDHMKGGKATKNSSAVTRQYVGVRTGGAPWDAASEADFVKLLTLQSAKELTKNNSRGDQPSILKDMESYLSDPNKLTEIQKYYPGYRGDSITPNSRIGIYPVVKNAIASVYGDFDDFPIVHSRSDGNISGVFFDRGQLYDYEITPMGELSYVESSHSDSYLVGFSVDSGWMQQKRGDRAVPLRDRKSSGYKKKNCISGKPCGNACIAKGLKCRVKLGDREVQALRQVQSSLGVINKGKQLVTENRQYLKGLAIAGVTVGAAMAGVGLAAYSIKRDLNQSSVDFNSIRQPPGGIPDEQTLAKYDTFQPGDLVRKNFKSPTMGVRQHYAVYAGKNLETGEHMVIDTGEDYKDRDSAPRVIMRGMTWTGDQPLNDSEWERVPDKDMHLVKGTQKLSQEEILDRANRMLYQKFEYQGFTSNCEAFARGIVEGKAYSQQGMKVSPLTNFTSRIVTNNALKLRTGIEGQMKLHEATAEKLIKEGRPPDDPQVIAARNAANSFKTKLEFYGGVGAEKPIVKLGEGREITGLSGYATDQYKMTAQQMVKELKKQKEMDLRRQWDKLPNPYTGQAESGPTKGKIYKPRTIADVAEELNVSLDPNYKPPTKQQPKKWEKGLNDIRGFFRQGQKTDADEEEILSADAVDAYLRSLGIRTPSEYEKAVDAIASEFPSIEESIRVTMFTDYLLVLFAMFSSDNEKT